MQNEVVIARYAEDLEWVGDIPEGFAVRIYNKGAPITSAAALRRADSVTTLANSGRESDTFLRHIAAKTAFSDGYTVFLQGDPFEHSPDVLRLLGALNRWGDLQPLSWCWLTSKNLPPGDILSQERSAFIDGARVRPEIFSLSTWNAIQFTDPGAGTVRAMYQDIHGLPDGTNIAAHFLHRCELPELAEAAARHLVGRFSYGALFAVRQDRLSRLPRRSLELALEAANGHKVYGYILERLWLHLCGEAFLLPASGAAPDFEDLGGVAQRFVPPVSPPPPHLRVVPAIKRRISRWAQA